MKSNLALECAVSDLAVSRKNHATAKTALAERRAAFDIENDDLIHHVASAAAHEAETERNVRALALAEFAATGSKQPHCQIGIVISKDITYNTPDALAWATIALPTLIVPAHIDVKAFEKIARTVPLPFVTVTDVPAVRIGSNLEVIL